MEINKKKIFISFFWFIGEYLMVRLLSDPGYLKFIGMLYTGHNLVENYKQFKSYPALQVNKFDRNTTTFPKLPICSHSQHSAYKVAAYYPS